MGPSRRDMQTDIERKLKEELHNNYDDYAFLKKYNEQNHVLLPGQIGDDNIAEYE